MTKRIGTARRKTRHILSVAKKDKGKLAPARFMYGLEIGDRVIFKAAPSIHAGMYFRRFHGKVGNVIGTKGSCYQVSVKDRSKTKTIIVNAIHLIKVKNGTKNN